MEHLGVFKAVTFLHFFLSIYFFYFLCKVVFIVTRFFIALSLTVLSLVRCFGQKRLLND